MATENYTAEQTAALVEAYLNGTPTEDLATAFNRSTRSVIAKLVKEGVYKAKEKAEQERSMTKAEIAAKAASLLGIESLESLEKGTKEDLRNLLDAITKLIGTST